MLHFCSNWILRGMLCGFVLAELFHLAVQAYFYSVTIDKAGNPWLFGSFQGTGTFSGSQIISKGGQDIFFAQYDSSGNLLLLKRAGGTGLDLPYSSWTDPFDGNIFVTGRFQAAADFGSTNITSVGGDDIFLSELGNTTPTPVELSSFSSAINGRNITLNWETKTELNSSQFEIDRTLISSQGTPSTWINVGSMKSAGTSVSPNKYSFTEKDLSVGKYQYRLKMIDNNGSFEYSNVIEVDVGLPVTYGLSQNYPNPFNPSTSINYQLPVDSKVTLEVYNITGQKVAEIVNQEQSAGYYAVSFESTSKLSSGVYIYRIIAVDEVTGNNFSSIKKMMGRISYPSSPAGSPRKFIWSSIRRSPSVASPSTARAARSISRRSWTGWRRIG